MISDGSDNSGAVNTGWTYGQVAVGGGGFVTGVFSTCEEGVFYARTDVGGAYRWDDSTKQWRSLNYWVSEDDVGLMGISAIAVDPSNAAKVYLMQVQAISAVERPVSLFPITMARASLPWKLPTLSKTTVTAWAEVMVSDLQ